MEATRGTARGLRIVAAFAIFIAGALGVTAFYLTLKNLQLRIRLEGYAESAAVFEARVRYDSGLVITYEAVAPGGDDSTRTNGGSVIKGYPVYFPADELFVKKFNEKIAELLKKGSK